MGCAVQGFAGGAMLREHLLHRRDDLAFAHLGATRARTAAAEGNVASRAVTRRCGYRETGRATGADGVVEVLAEITPGAWRRRRLDDVVVEGVEPFLATITP